MTWHRARSARATIRLTVTNSLYTSVSSVASSIVTSSTNVVGQRQPGGRAVLQRRPRAAGELRLAVRPGQPGELPRLQHAGGRLGDYGSRRRCSPFNGIQPTATVDEGHNWLNLVYGPLTLSRPGVAGGATNAEMMIASAAIGTAQGAYSLPAGSKAVNAGTNTDVARDDGQ